LNLICVRERKQLLLQEDMAISPPWRRFAEIAGRTIPNGRVWVDGTLCVESSTFVNGEHDIMETFWREHATVADGTIDQDALIVRFAEEHNMGIAFATYALLMQCCNQDRPDVHKVCVHQTSQLICHLRIDGCLSRSELECLVWDGAGNSEWGIAMKLGSAWLRTWNAANKIANAWLRYRERRTVSRCLAMLMCLKRAGLSDHGMIEREVLPRALER